MITTAVSGQRRLTRRNLGFVPKLLRARREAVALMRGLRPRVVVSVGGYASMPAVLAARRLGVPVVVVSYDRVPGRASALSARRAAACAVAFEDSPLPRAHVTGAPVRQAVLDVDRRADRDAARARLGLPSDRFVVAVMGGSQGSGVLNAAVRGYVDAHRDDTGLAVRHAVGERFLGAAAPPRDGADGVLYQPLGYEPAMHHVYAAADVLVGRGGAGTVHEVAVTGVPAVLVPWAGAAEDHQRENVAWLADRGGAVMLAEAELDRLADVLERLRHDPAERERRSSTARSMGEVHRGGAVARLVESVALA
ncbi:MAG: glycosyltransferase [Ilumatobacteraceae bacterium]